MKANVFKLAVQENIDKTPTIVEVATLIIVNRVTKQVHASLAFLDTNFTATLVL